MSPQLLDELERIISAERLARFDQILEERTRHLTVVLEDIHHPHNASACLRSCEAFGIQDVYIVENFNQFEACPEVACGASRWLTLHRFDDEGDNSRACTKTLRSRGYRVLAATPPPDSRQRKEIGIPTESDDGTLARRCWNLADLDVSEKTALLFGSERDGLSDTALSQVDGFLVIPMHGFTQSFNISVAVAICLQQWTQQLRQSEIVWKLSEPEREKLRAEWIRQSTRKWAEAIERRFAAEG